MLKQESYLHSNKWLDYKQDIFEKHKDKPMNLHSNKWLDYKPVVGVGAGFVLMIYIPING